MPDSIIFLDLDGVLADWHTAALRVFHIGRDQLTPEQLANRNLHEIVTGGDEDAMWAAIDAHGSHWWAGLEPYPWTQSLWKLCRSITATVVLTKPSLNPQCADGKLRWIKKHLNTRNFLIGPAKWACARPGAMLVDDYDKNCVEFRRHGGQAVVWPQPWNSCADLPVETAIEGIQHIARQLSHA